MIEKEIVDASIAATNQLYSGINNGKMLGTELYRRKFTVNGKTYFAVEQNPKNVSPGGALARKGHQVAQILDQAERRLIGYVDLNARHFIEYKKE